MPSAPPRATSTLQNIFEFSITAKEKKCFHFLFSFRATFVLLMNRQYFSLCRLFALILKCRAEADGNVSLETDTKGDWRI